MMQEIHFNTLHGSHAQAPLWVPVALGLLAWLPFIGAGIAIFG